MIGSKLKQLHVFKGPRVELTKDGKLQKWQPTSGYIDISEGRIVFITRLPNGSAEEKSFDLQSLTEKVVRVD